MSELLRKNRLSLIAAGALAGSLLLGACGENKETDEAQEPEKTVEQTLQEREQELLDSAYSTALDNKIISEPILLEDGRRVTYLPNSSGHWSGSYPVALTEYCVDADLLTISEQIVNRGAGGGVDRSPDHPWCEDGKLTEQDFLG